MRAWMAMAVMTGCAALTWGQSAQPAKPMDEKPRSADTFAVLRADWARNLHDKRVEASVAEYAPDGEFLDPSGGRVRGMAALRELFQTVTATYDSDLKFTSIRSEVNGAIAYDSGTYQEILIVRASNRVEHSSGSYLTIYQKGKGGAWLIAEQVWTGSISDAPESADGLAPHPGWQAQMQVPFDCAPGRVSTRLTHASLRLGRLCSGEEEAYFAGMRFRARAISRAARGGWFSQVSMEMRGRGM